MVNNKQPVLSNAVIITVVIAVIAATGGFWYYQKSAHAAPQPVVLTPEAKAYVRNLQITDSDMKAHESLFCWSQWALPVHDAADDAFMALPPHTTSTREDDVRPVVEGARTGRADGTSTRRYDTTSCTVGSHPCGG